MRKLVTLLLALTMTAAMSVNALAADIPSYSFGTGGNTIDGFGTYKSYDEPVTPDSMSTNVRRDKNAAYFPPAYGVFSGEIPTNATSPYHNNLPESGFLPANQDLPKTGGENYAPGNSTVTAETAGGFLPTTSQTANLNTAPWFYEDGSIGTLYVERMKKNIKVYEGEDLSNLKIGAGHFASTSAWDGNVGLAGHNRGGSAYFSFVKDLQNGDKLKYTTKYGTRTYEVYSKVQVSELDSSALSWSADNILTLITCVADVPELRYSVQAREIR